jgi:hypothetical protein
MFEKKSKWKMSNTAIESFLSNTFCIISFCSDLSCRAPTTFKLEGEVTSLSESSQGEVGDNREKWGDFWETLHL